MNYSKSSRKAISPLIAGVLLVVFTIVISYLIVNFMSGYVTETTGEASTQSANVVGCTNERIGIDKLWINDGLSNAITAFADNKDLKNMTFTHPELSDYSLWLLADKTKTVGSAKLSLKGFENADITEKMIINGSLEWVPDIAIDKLDRIHIVELNRYIVLNGTTLEKIAEANISTDNPNLNWAKIAVDSQNNAHITFKPSTNYVYYKKFNSNGNNLTGDILVSSSNAMNDWSDMGVDSEGNVHIVWDTSWSAAWPTEIAYKKLDNNGNNLTDDIRVTYEGQAYYPAMVVDTSGNVHIIWTDWRSTGNGYGLYYIKLNNSGANLTYDRKIGYIYDNYGSSIAADSDGNIHVGWNDDYAGSWQGYYRKLDNNGLPLTNTITISESSTSSGYRWAYPELPYISIDSENNAYLAWKTRKDYEKTDIYYMKLDNGIYSKDGKKRISYASNLYDGTDQLVSAIDSKDNAYFAWFDEKDLGVYISKLGKSYASNISVNINNNGSGEWSYTGDAAGTISTGDISSGINEYVSGFSAGLNVDYTTYETPHNYNPDMYDVKYIFHPGAANMTLNIYVDTEANADYLRIYDKNGNLASELSGSLGNYTVTVQGDVAKLVFSSGRTNEAYGYMVNNVTYYLDYVSGKVPVVIFANTSSHGILQAEVSMQYRDSDPVMKVLLINKGNAEISLKDIKVFSTEGNSCTLSASKTALSSSESITAEASNCSIACNDFSVLKVTTSCGKSYDFTASPSCV